MTNEEDDPLPELPSLGDRSDEEPSGPDDLGLEASEEEDEDVGLEDSTGVEGDESAFALDLPPKDAVAETGANEDDVDAIPIEGLDGDDEYGWTDANESSEEPWDDVLVDLGKEGTTAEDAGEEGVDEVFEIGKGDDDVSHLPALSGHDPEDDADDLALGADALIAATVAGFDEEMRMVSAAMLPRLTCEVAKIADGPVWCVDDGYAGGRGVFKLDGSTRALEDRTVTSLAAWDGALLLVAEGAMRRTDAGFVACNPDARVLAWVAREGANAWGVAEGGALFMSDDYGEHWNGPLLLAPAIAVAVPDEGGVVVLTAGRDAPAQIVRSNDRGVRWAASPGPTLTDGPRFVTACGDAVAVACADDPRGPLLSNDRSKTWSRVPGLPRTGAIALVRETGGLTLYAAHEGFVARHRPGGGEPALVIEVGTVRAIRAERAGERTILLVASDDGLHRVEIDPERA